MLRKVHLFVISIAFVMIAAHAHAVPVALELHLLFDTSGSVDQAEFELQRNGYVAAFNDPGVQSAIASLAGSGGIAVAVSYFSTTGNPNVPADFTTAPDEVVVNPQIDWTQLTLAGDASNFATTLSELQPTDFDPPLAMDGETKTVPDGGTGSTNIASGIAFAIDSILGNDFEGERLAIDVSGDGKQNIDLLGVGGESDCGSSGDPACDAVVNDQRDAAEAAGITINGLAIIDDFIDLQTWYAANVITSDGFALSATFDTFADAVTDKIGREITGGTTVPEPTTLMLLGLGIAGMGFARKRLRYSQQFTY